jgi:hypothetical protein
MSILSRKGLGADFNWPDDQRQCHCGLRFPFFYRLVSDWEEFPVKELRSCRDHFIGESK